MRHIIFLWAGLALVLATTAGSALAWQAAAPAAGMNITLSPPQNAAEGRLKIRISKQRFLEEIDRAIPASVDLPDQKLGNQLIYRDVQLNNVKAHGLKPTSMTFEGGVFHVAGEPEVAGNLNALYEHVVVTTEVKTIAKVFGREIKQAVPVVHSDWRPKGAAPFSIKAEVRGTCRVSFPPAESLDQERLRLETRSEYVRIREVRLASNEPLYQIVKEVVGAVGKAFPNEGFNKPIVEALTRDIDVDPFGGFSAADRAKLSRYKTKSVDVKTTPDEVVITAILINR